VVSIAPKEHHEPAVCVENDVDIQAAKERMNGEDMAPEGQVCAGRGRHGKTKAGGGKDTAARRIAVTSTVLS